MHADPMVWFEKLGELVAARWRERSFKEEAFPAVAAVALDEARLVDRVTPLDIVRWVLTTRRLPGQIDPDARFGQPPITVHRGRGFYIDVLFWLDGTTNIHQHGFWGAFQVLAGSSIHCRFGFDLAEEVNHRLRIGALRLEETELLGLGAIRRIQGGELFIHSLFHLDRPSVSIVIRTLDDPRSVPQYTYRRPALCFDPVKEVERTRCLQVVNLLRALRHAERDRLVAEYLGEADLLGVLQSVLLLSLEDPRGSEELRSLIEPARRRHGALIDLVLPVVDEQRRELAIVRARQTVADPAHRFFLGLLLNLSERRLLLDFVRARTGADDAAATVVGWVRQMAAASPEQALLGQRFDDPGLRALEAGLLGKAPAAGLEARHAALAASPIFKPCFTD